MLCEALLRVYKPGGKVAVPIWVAQFLALALLVVLDVHPPLGEVARWPG